MRPVNLMIEFKQIIGRGTRLFEGKDYFTVYDFVKAHQHFLDTEWDGEPEAPDETDPCQVCSQKPCICEKPVTACPQCEQTPCACPKEPCPTCGERPCRCNKRAKVKLADGKARTIQYMTCTSFWHPDGKPMSAQQFMELLYGKLPDFFHDEDELRVIWSAPDTRKQLLQGLSERGFGHAQLTEMQRIIEAEASDLFDVLAHVAYAKAPVTREVRANSARAQFGLAFNYKQQQFLDFVLQHYVAVGVEELDPDKLTPLLQLRYHNSISDALAELGQAAQVRELFAGFQKYLYTQSA